MAEALDMAGELDVDEIARTLMVGISLASRRMRQLRLNDEVTPPEISALARLDRGGPTTSSALAKQEQISPQSMGATLAGLEARGLVARHPDPDDGRRVILSLTDAGRNVLRNRRTAKVETLAKALSGGFSETELARLKVAAPLIERLAQRI
ncbi:MAG TPA: MarR family transcriptional regulator [Pseudonocardiaceae bacterium]